MKTHVESLLPPAGQPLHSRPLTPEERAELESHPHVHVLTLTGSVDFLPIERSADIAGAIVEALAATPRAP